MAVALRRIRGAAGERVARLRCSSRQSAAAFREEVVGRDDHAG